MRILFQHPHRESEISGVVTFVQMATSALRNKGHDVRIFSSAGASMKEVLEHVKWADVVHLNSGEMRLFFLAKLLRRPVVQHYHFPFWGTWKENEKDRQRGFWSCFWQSLATPWRHGAGWRFSKAFLRYFTSTCARVVLRVVCALTANARVAPTDFIRKDAQLPGTTAVVHYPIDILKIQNFYQTDFPEVPCFTFVGRVTAAKGPQNFLEAAILLRDVFPFKICLAGDGDLLSSLQERSREVSMQDRIVFTGRVSHDEALNLMARSSAVVVPSQWDDPSPYVVIEASALGRPVIGSSRGGIPEIIGPGILVDDAKPESISLALRKLGQDKEEASRMGLQCSRFAREQFNPEKTADDLIAIYKTLHPH